MSFDWVEHIQQRLVYQKYEFLNCGENGYTAFHLLAKLQEVRFLLLFYHLFVLHLISKEPGSYKVDNVIVQLGLNDVLAALNVDFQKNARSNLPKELKARQYSLENYIDAMNQIHTLLSERAPGKLIFLT